MFGVGFEFEWKSWTNRGDFPRLTLWFSTAFKPRKFDVIIGLRPLSIGFNGRWILTRGKSRYERT